MEPGQLSGPTWATVIGDDGVGDQNALMEGFNLVTRLRCVVKFVGCLKLALHEVQVIRPLRSFIFCMSALVRSHRLDVR